MAISVSRVGAGARDYQRKFVMVELTMCAAIAANMYIVVFMRSRGYSNTTIGSIMSVTAFVSVIAQFVWGVVSDKIGSIRKVLIGCLVAAAISMMALPLTHSALLSGLAFAVIVFFRDPLMPLLDSWVVHETSRDARRSYGSIRLWGSFGFAVAAYVYGRLVDLDSVNIIFPAYFLFAALTAILCSGIYEHRSEVGGSLRFRDLKVGRLLRDYYYVTFVAFALLLRIPLVASMTFLPNLIEQIGGNNGQLGAVHCFRALAEIPFFLVGHRLLERFGHTKLILMGGTLYLSQQLIYLSADSQFSVVFGQILQGPAYGMFATGMLHYVHSLAPEELRATAQTAAASLSAGLSAIVGNYVGGVIIDAHGLHFLYVASVILTLMALGFFMVSLPLGRHLHLHRAVSTAA